MGGAGMDDLNAGWVDPFPEDTRLVFPFAGQGSAHLDFRERDEGNDEEMGGLEGFPHLVVAPTKSRKRLGPPTRQPSFRGPKDPAPQRREGSRPALFA